MKLRLYNYLMLSLVGISAFTGCKKLVDVSAPVTSVTSASAYTNDATAAAVLTGLYTQLSTYSFTVFNIPSLTFYGGMSADEYVLWSGLTGLTQINYYHNQLAANSNGSEFWNSIYPMVFTCNSAIEEIGSSNSLTPAVRQQLLGEAKFMRAWFYFYLTNLYGDIPMPLSTDYKSNSSLGRTSMSQVYKQAISDLTDASTLLSSGYVYSDAVTATSERTRPNKWTAEALLARVYLYAGIWDSAVMASSTVIAKSPMYSLDSLKGVFLKNSTEAIWQLQPVTTGVTNTEDAYVFVMAATGPSVNFPLYLSSRLLNSFEPGDNRRLLWIDSVKVSGNTYYFPYKYKVNALNAPVSEYAMMLRLGEQYLIRAEANAELGNISGSSGAIADLNVIRARAGLAPYSGGTDKQSVLMAMLHERQVEFFSELGHRWLDIKRYGVVDSVMTADATMKGTTWNTNQKLYPLPVGDIQKDANLTQNPGY